jgi:hypothetical protein
MRSVKSFHVAELFHKTRRKCDSYAIHIEFNLVQCA